MLLVQVEGDTSEEVEPVVPETGRGMTEEEEEEEDVLKPSANADFVTLFTNQQSPGVCVRACVRACVHAL